MRLPHGFPSVQKYRFLRGLLVVLVGLSLQACGESPLTFDGHPPARAEFAVFLRGQDTLPDPTPEGHLLVRAHLAFRWKVPPADFAAHPYLVDLQEGRKTHSRRLRLPGPSDSLLDTMVCETGEVTARLMADLGSGYLLELSNQWVMAGGSVE